MARPILLLHGALGDARQFAPVLDLLAERNVLPVNFSGHGGTPLPELFSINGFVRETLDAMDEHRIETADILGYSMGGYVALQLARDHPDRAGRIITIGTKFNWTPEEAAGEVRMMNPDVIEQKIPAFAAMLAARHAPEDWKTIMRRTAEMMTRLGHGEAMTDADFARVPHLVLVCRGSADHMVHEAESVRTASALPHGQFRELPGLKHPLESIPPLTLADLCREWFDGEALA
jgi:pimeloyl-ACP methyl ester carboxylesterase